MNWVTLCFNWICEPKCARLYIYTVEPLYSTIGGVHEIRSCYRRIVVKITRCCYDSDLMSETRHDNTKSTHCRDVGALFLGPPHRQGMQRSYETYSNRTWPFCQTNYTPHNPRGIEMINHIYSCQIIAANGIVLRVWISVPPCFPSR